MGLRGVCSPKGPYMIIRTALLAAFIAAPSFAIAEPGHDGKWAVEIVTEKGWCDVYR